MRSKGAAALPELAIKGGRRLSRETAARQLTCGPASFADVKFTRREFLLVTVKKDDIVAAPDIEDLGPR